MASRIKEDANVRLGLMGRDRCSQSQRVGDSCVEIVHLEVEVHHRALRAVGGRPHRPLVVVSLLEHDVDGPLRGREYRRSWLLVTDGLAQQ